MDKILRKYLTEGIESVAINQTDLQDILKGYLEAAIWTEEEQLNDSGEDLSIFGDSLKNKSFDKFLIDDLSVDSRIQAYIDIKTFIKNAGSEAIGEALEVNDTFRLGMDIWLTRNRHGSGFFDHSYDNEEILRKAAQALGGVDLYVSDNNQLEFSNAHR
jgi:hypothetical protein